MTREPPKMMSISVRSVYLMHFYDAEIMFRFIKVCCRQCVCCYEASSIVSKTSCTTEKLHFAVDLFPTLKSLCRCRRVFVMMQKKKNIQPLFKWLFFRHEKYSMTHHIPRARLRGSLLNSHSSWNFARGNQNQTNLIGGKNKLI